MLHAQWDLIHPIIFLLALRRTIHCPTEGLNKVRQCDILSATLIIEIGAKQVIVKNMHLSCQCKILS